MRERSKRCCPLTTVVIALDAPWPVPIPKIEQSLQSGENWCVGLHMPSIGEFACLGAFAGFIVLLVWLLRGSPRPKYSPPPPLPRGFPVLNMGRGRYRISGVDRQSKLDTTWYVEADSPDNARVKAELEGIVVTDVQFECPT